MKKFVAFILRLLNCPTQHHTKELSLAISDIDWAGAPTKNLPTNTFQLSTSDNDWAGASPAPTKTLQLPQNKTAGVKCVHFTPAVIVLQIPFT